VQGEHLPLSQVVTVEVQVVTLVTVDLEGQGLGSLLDNGALLDGRGTQLEGAALATQML
jgi:hypothetical protein